VSRRICSSPISFVLRSARDNNDENNNDAIALNEIRQRLAEITESLEQARKREEEIRLDNNLLKGRRDGTIVETENIVTSIKRGYA
jgi:2,3-bisphosphoglycerate-independent phosphoglycerate mutase